MARGIDASCHNLSYRAKANTKNNILALALIRYFEECVFFPEPAPAAVFTACEAVFLRSHFALYSIRFGQCH